MLIKFATIDVDLFDHLDLGITRHWRAIELDELTEEQIDALRTYNGRIVQVHAEDAEAFAGLSPESVGELGEGSKPRRGRPPKAAK